jgi:hypothetical protein
MKDILVAKATLSGTGKFRKMIFWSNGIKSIFGYENIRLATVQNGGLIIYTPKTASKCLLNYILYRTKPTIGKMNTALNVLTTL